MNMATSSCEETAACEIGRGALTSVESSDRRSIRYQTGLVELAHAEKEIGGKRKKKTKEPHLPSREMHTRARALARIRRGRAGTGGRGREGAGMVGRARLPTPASTHPEPKLGVSHAVRVALVLVRSVAAVGGTIAALVEIDAPEDVKRA